MDQIKHETLSDNSETTINSRQVEILKNNFPQCFDQNGDFIVEKLNEIISDSGTAFSKESYGLNWLGKSYARLLANENPLTLLAEDKEHNRKPENKNSQNILIKGDNLEVLKHLRGAYSESIKMIYIDPPYNTGSDGFVYQDDRKFTTEQLANLAGIDNEEAKRILEFTQSKANSHSAWLTFMYPRLYIARDLLREDGIIFVSIDDNELAQLKILCNEIYGESNFIGVISRSTGTRMGSGSKGVARELDYIVVYAKTDIGNLSKLLMTEEEASIYNEEDSKGKYLLRTVRRTGGENRREDRPSMFFPVIDPDGNEVFPIAPEGWESRWTCGQDTYNELVEKKEIVWKKVEKNGVDRWQVYQKHYQNESGREVSDLWRSDTGDLKAITEINNLFDSSEKFSSPETIDLLYKIIELASNSDRSDIVLSFFENYLKELGLTTSDLWTSEAGNKKATREVSALFDSLKVFSNPKSIELISKVIELGSSPRGNDIVLDFFGGSGTTANAVLELNSINKLNNRTFITVQLDEPTKTSSVAYANGYKNIFEITKARIVKAAAKIRTENPDYEGDLGFKIFETLPIFEGYLDNIERLEGETLELFDGSILSDEQIEHLLTTWKVYDGISLTQPLIETDLSGYVAYRHDKVLYLMHQGFTTESLRDFLSKLDETDNDGKAFDVEKLVLFGYNFNSKNQLEINEAVRQYQNRKEKTVSVVVRY